MISPISDNSTAILQPTVQEASREWGTIYPDGKQIYMCYDESSNKLRHKVYVETVVEGVKKSYVVDVGKIDTKNATRIEMQALVFDQYNSEDRPNHPILIEVMTLIDTIASTKNPSYAQNPKADFFEERLNFVELVKGLLESPEKNPEFFPDQLLNDFWELFIQRSMTKSNEIQALTENRTFQDNQTIPKENYRWVL
jgi:hypothetical protein